MKARSNHGSRSARRLVHAALVLLALPGCSSPYGWNKSLDRSVDDAYRQARADRPGAALPSEVSDALLPPLQMTLPDGAKAPIEQRFDLSVNNAAVKQVLMGLVEGTPYSVVVHPEVSGTISLNLKEVTVPEVIEAIRRGFGYEYTRDGNRFFVLSRTMQTRIFPVNYLNFTRKGNSNTRVTSGELTRTNTTQGANAANATSATSARSTIEVETTSKADFWEDLKDSLKTIVGADGGRQVVVNPQSNLVIVRAMPHELRLVEDFLGMTHAAVNRQVVLEAKIIEVELNDGFQAGINWSALGTSDRGTLTAGQIGGGTIFSGSGVSEIAGKTGILNPHALSPVSGTNTSAFGGVFSLALQATDFAAFVELLQSQGNVQVLSSPRVSTVNNQKAVIKVGGDEFFITGITNTATSVGSTTVFIPEVHLTPFFSGIALDVTPQIDDSGNIILHIHPSVSEVAQKNKSFIISDDDYSLPLAVSTIQESDNVVRASSGQVIVIGGLMKEGSNDQNASVPFLGNIPLLGNLFKHKKVTRIKKELVILLKPTVIDGDRVWDGLVQDSQDRVNKIRRER